MKRFFCTSCRIVAILSLLAVPASAVDLVVGSNGSRSEISQ